MGSIAEPVAVSCPRRLAAFKADRETATSAFDAELIGFQLSSKSGERVARLLGHSLSLQPDVPVQQRAAFLSPLTVEWAPSRTRVQLFDSDLHGYHVAIGSTSAHRRGTGEPQPWRCPACSGEQFSIRIVLEYGGAASDLWEDEPDSSIENYFTGLRVFGMCATCSVESRALGMDV